MKIANHAISFCAIALTVTNTALASVDHEVVGSTWEIAEPDMRLVIAHQIRDHDWEGVQDRLLGQAKNPERVFNGFDVPETSKRRVTHQDPSMTLQEDIGAFIKQDDGSYEWEVLHEAGKTVNPLDQLPRRPSWILAFDPQDPEQRELARTVVEEHDGEIKPVITRGNPGEIASEWGRPVYHVQEQHFRKMGLQYVPSVIGVHPDRPKRIRTVAFPMPATQQDLMEAIE